MSFVRENWMLLAVFVASGGMLLWPYIQRVVLPVRELGTQSAVQLINVRNALLLDVRESKDYDGGRVPNAIHIPLGQLATRGGELAKLTARPIIIYCAQGGQSRGAEGVLGKQGFKEIYHLKGGFAAWKAAGLPVEK